MTDQKEQSEIEANAEGSGSRQEPVVMLPMPECTQRIETGAVQFGDDWPGVFIRGDNAAFYANAINTLVMHDKNDPVALAVLGGLWKLLESCKQT